MALLCAATAAGMVITGAAVSAPGSSTASVGPDPFPLSAIYVTNRGAANSVSVVDPTTNTVIDTIDVGAGPAGIAVTPDGSKVYVANTFDNSVSVINTATGMVTATVTSGIGNGPTGVAVSPNGSEAYITNSFDTSVSVINTADDKVTATIPVGGAPQAVAFSPDGLFAYVANGDGTVSVINTAMNRVVDTVPVPSGLTDVAVSPDGTTVYVTSHDGMLSVIKDNAVVDTINVGSDPLGVAVAPDGTVYVANSGSATVSVINPTSLTEIKMITVGTTPTGVAVSPEGSTVYVTNNGSHTVSAITTTDDSVTSIPGFTSPIGVATAPEGKPLVITATAHEDNSDISTANGYRVEIANPNSAAAEVGEITVTLPPGFTYTAGSTVGATTANPTVSGSTATGLTLTWTGPFTVPGSGEIAIDFDVTVSEVPGTYTIDATATSDDNVTPARNTAPITVNPAANLSLTKTATATSVTPGETFSYDLTAHNAGPSEVTDAVITDTLPDQFAFDSSTSTAGCTAVGQTVTCKVGSLGGNHTEPVRIEVTVRGEAAADDTENTAVISSSVFDPDESNNSASAGVEVHNRVDLSLTKVASPSTVTAGDEVTFTITVTNAGPSIATATLHDALPAGLTALSLAPGADCDLQTLTCTLQVPPGSSTVTLVARADDDASGMLTNEATVEAPDNVSGEQRATADVDVTPSADLAISKKLDSPLVAGDIAYYELHVTNKGPSLATGVTVTDDLPADVTFDSNGSSPECTGPAAGPVTCTIGDLEPGADSIVKVAVNVPASVPDGTHLTNTASVTGDQPDPDPGNDTAMVTDPVTGAPPTYHITVDKTADVSPVTAGGTARWTIDVHNDGPSAATDVLVSDQPGANITVTSLTGPGCSLADLSCLIPAIPAGDSVKITATADVDPEATGTVENCASGVQPATSESCSTVPVTQSASLTLAKQSVPTVIAAGGTVDYPVQLGNQGPSTATGVVLTDRLPAGLTFLPGQSSSGCTLTGGTPATGQTITCAVTALDPGETQDFDIAAVSAPGVTGVVTDTDTAVAADAVLRAGVTASADTTIQAEADLSITKTAPAAFAGADATWTIAVANAGPSTATGAVVTDTFPAGVSIVSVATDSGTCTHTGQTLSCTLGAVAPTGAATITVVTRTAPGLVPPGQQFTMVSNAASVDFGGDTDTDNDTSTFPLTVFAKARVVPAKTVSPAPLSQGGLATYRIRVTNRGPSVATAISAVDTLPRGLTFVAAASDPRCALTKPGVVTCADPGPLQPGASTTFTVVARVSATLGIGSVVVNDAIADASQRDPDPADAARAVSVIGRPSVPVTG